jgi:lantibiotic modifying enzyme
MDGLTEMRFIALAREIGFTLLDEAQRCEDGSLTWGRGFGVDTRPAIDAGIYNGRSGEALFLAALHAATGESELAQASLQAMGGVRAGVETAGYVDRLRQRIGIGLTGIGSLIYALVRIGGFLGRPDLVDDAQCLAAAITSGAIRRDSSCDVFGGSAGALLGLLALVEAGVQDAIDGAVRCAEHLLETRVLDAVSGHRTWQTRADGCWAGFAHGASGIAHALLRLHARVGERRYYDAAMEAFAFERSLYRPEGRNWPAYRAQPSKEMLSGWCHGAPGVGLSRLAALAGAESEDKTTLSADLVLAVEQVTSDPLRPPHNLCCGTLARFELLAEAGRGLGIQSLSELADALARGLAFHIERHGHHDAPPDGPDPDGPGLWQGLAGTGYELLRAARPDECPCVLLLA